MKILVKNENFGQKWKFWLENKNFGQKSRFWLKTKISVKNCDFS